MTIGPAPMMRTLLMSVRLGMLALLHQLRETIEQIAHVMRPGARLGMPLEAERRAVGTGQTLKAAVEERNVRRSQVFRKRAGVDRKAVVLAGDDDRPVVQILHRMVGAVMPELHLQRLCARSEAHELVPQADSERRNAR